MMDYTWIKEKFEKLEVIGRGSFGEVLSGYDKDSHVRFAIKLTETTNKDEFNVNSKEVMNLSRLKEMENIMTYEDCYFNVMNLPDGRQLFQIIIIMELAEQSLEDKLQITPQGLDRDFIIKTLDQIAIGLDNAHKVKCAHLDLKPENVLFVNNQCKISDWGGSVILKSEKSSSIKSDLACTRGYASPEIIAEDYFDRKKINYYLSDIYSFGILGLRLCGIHKKNIRKIPRNDEKVHNDYITSLIEENILSLELGELLAMMTKFQPLKRVELEKIKKTLKNLMK